MSSTCSITMIFMVFCSFLGTSGAPVEDIYKFSRLDNRVEILEKTLLWGHIAPTAPDTLGTLTSDKN